MLASADTIHAMFELTKRNMQNLYDSAGGDWLWNDRRKMEELNHRRARFICVFDSQDSLEAFVHFRFELEDLPVCYVYEIQVGEPGKGKGRLLMELLEKYLLENTEITRIMLTVLKQNSKAASFYKKKLGYSLDESNPEDDAPYEILSKDI
jgi:GNAT superfamily N-acetyltransferase